MDKQGTLKWRFDVSAFRLIGRDLITDRITALFELVKNCYDANATEVTIRFNNAGKTSDDNSITISDNGHGMSFEDVRDKWMVIGTSSKRQNPVSAAPFSRRCVGEKGIGRFAVDKLGDRLTISTKFADSVEWLSVNIDWGAYQKRSEETGNIRLFTEVENQYNYSEAVQDDEHGTILTIKGLRDVWEKKDIIRLLKESSRIVSPYVQLTYPFRVHVIAEEFNLDAWDEEFRVEASDMATISGIIGYDRDRGIQQTLLFNSSTGKMEVAETGIKPFGGVEMRLYFFDKNARSAFRKKYPTEEIDGVKIYRDGIITTPFAEREEESDKKRDILGIDKRLWQDLFNKVGTREIIGIVNITKDGNPKIIDATNRQDFTDTPEYRELKEFILLQVEAFDAYKVYIRSRRPSRVIAKMDDAGKALSDLSSRLEATIAQADPQTAAQLLPLRESVGNVAKNLNTAIKTQDEEEGERQRHESMYLRIMSRQEDAINVTHAVKTSMGKIHRQAGFFNNRFPNEALNEYFSLYAKQIYYEMTQLDRATDELFDYSRASLPFTDVDIHQLLNYLIDSFKDRFDSEGITIEKRIEENLILNCNEMFFYDIVQNITDNAIKAMKDSPKKVYRCTVKALEDKLMIDFSDTGCGIPVEKREWVFGIYNTTTAEQGGGGIGLYAVRLRVNALHGTVRVIDSEFAPLGVTIHIELPFKR